MIEVVAFGLAGVLQPLESLWIAEIESALARLAHRGQAPPRFREIALERRRRGESWALARTLRELVVELSPRELRQLLLEVRQAVPGATPPAPGDALRALRAAHRLVFVDAGPGDRMDRWLERLGASGLSERRLWTDDLGEQARPPRPLAFRWLADRLGVPPGDCLYVAGTEPLRQAALRAGWSVWGEVPDDPGRVADLDSLLAELDGSGSAERMARSS